MKITPKSDTWMPTQTRSLPAWITSRQGQDIEHLAFSSGAALAVLDAALGDVQNAPSVDLWRDRLALDAAVACLKLGGRIETLSGMRDAVCLARASDALGPAGEMFSMWRKAAQINLKARGWQQQVARLLPKQMGPALPAVFSKKGSPVALAVHALSEALHQFPRHETAALVLADVALARAMGWSHPVPLGAAYLTAADLRIIVQGGAQTAHRMHGAVIAACDTGLRRLGDVSRRAAQLNAITHRLRAKGAAQAVLVFLRYDAVSPSGMLSPMIKGSSVAMTDRAARRLCERLVHLGVVRELTGRPSFRLYGL
ncbi:MAG: DUF1403 family protein [Sulfitobacter sp.]